MSAKVIALRSAAADRLELSDEALLAGCAAREASALGLLYRRHHAGVYRFLSRMMGSRCPELDDIAQQVFLGAWNSAGGFRQQSSVRAWLLGIAANTVRKHYRSERRRRSAFEWLAQRVTASPPGPEEEVARQQLVDRLAAALEALPHDLRVAYVMCELEELAGVEAARVLGVKPGTLWRRLHDARKRLRGLIAPEVS
jgi:RNA polymerase sigma-70 factor (ECF subfamily)